MSSQAIKINGPGWAVKYNMYNEDIKGNKYSVEVVSAFI